MTDDEPDKRRRAIKHEWLCPACAHRSHEECEGSCVYCSTPCMCPCGRWAIPLSRVKKE